MHLRSSLHWKHHQNWSFIQMKSDIVCGQIRWTERTIRAVAVEFDRLFLFLTFICVAMSSIWGAVTFVVVRWVYSGYCVYCLCLTTDGHARVRSKCFGAIIFYTVARKRISLPDERWFVESCTNTQSSWCTSAVSDDVCSGMRRKTVCVCVHVPSMSS